MFAQILDRWRSRISTSGLSHRMYFLLGIAAIALVAFATRFWNLGGLAPVVFDEVYYPKFALNYLQGEQLFDAHPPLGKYMIALGIQLFGNNPFGYRVVDALIGSLLPLVTVALVYQLSFRTEWALLAGWFTTLDGLLMVESRYGLINIYLVFFGMLSQLCMVLAFQQPRKRWFWAIAAGIMFGAACSVKWSAITYLVGLIAISGIIWWRYGQRLTIAQAIVSWVAVPALVYILVWIPHLAINNNATLIMIHQQILAFHQNLGVGKTEPIHPYCASWWTWPWLIRPIAYYYKVSADGKLINDVHALGNPWLYWLGAIATIGCFQLIINRLWNKAEAYLNNLGEYAREVSNFADLSPQYLNGMPIYVVASFAGHYLPWSLTQRCTFLYHYMPASVFAFIALAIAADWCWRQRPKFMQVIGSAIPIIVTLSFIFWLPIYLGLSITPAHFRLLMWFSSWI